jgi:hypothetical protein
MYFVRLLVQESLAYKIGIQMAMGLIPTRIVLMIEVLSSCETSDNIYQTTWRNIPKNSHLYTRLRENPKSHRRFITVVTRAIQRILLKAT